jgi:hypothetical protein
MRQLCAHRFSFSSLLHASGTPEESKACLCLSTDLTSIIPTSESPFKLLTPSCRFPNECISLKNLCDSSISFLNTLLASSSRLASSCQPAFQLHSVHEQRQQISQRSFSARMVHASFPKLRWGLFPIPHPKKSTSPGAPCYPSSEGRRPSDHPLRLQLCLESPLTLLRDLLAKSESFVWFGLMIECVVQSNLSLMGKWGRV